MKQVKNPIDELFGTENPIDELLTDLTLDKVVKAQHEMTKSERLARVRALRAQRARWVPKGKKKDT